MYFTKSFKYSLGLFICINLVLYIFIQFFNSLIPFNAYNYYIHAYHFLQDPRYYHQSFNFLRSLDQYDAQWYMFIASKGYSTIKIGSYSNYAFFPLYPMSVYIVNFLFGNIELSAFIVANILLVADFISLYYIVTKLYDEKIAFRTSILMYLFPFSIFFRSYFSEGLFLFLILWFSYFLIKHRFLQSALFLSLVCITRPNGLVLMPLYCFFLFKTASKENGKISVIKILTYIAIMMIPFCIWLYFCNQTTGNSYYWLVAQKGWFRSPYALYPIKHNITQILHFWSLPFHDFNNSKLDIIVLLTTIVLLSKSRKKLAPELWWLSVLFAIPVLFFKDTLSYSRYQSVSFPLFIYLAQVLQGTKFTVLSIIFFVLLLLTALFFVNWFWVG